MLARVGTEIPMETDSDNPIHGTMTVSNSDHVLAMMQEHKEAVDLQFARVQASITSLRASNLVNFNRINNNVRHQGGTIQSAFANQIRQQIEGRVIDESSQEQRDTSAPNVVGVYRPLDPRARLSRPKDLTELWLEYTNGLHGRKAAKEFTSAEKNAKGTKQKYYRRLNIWRIQGRLMDGGMNVYAANALIAQVTGARTVTTTIDKIVAFKKVYENQGGCHPMLQNRHTP
jgi:hypothetical protein